MNHLDELKRFVDAMEMISIEIFTNKDILKMHHILQRLYVLHWVYNYTREQAAYPVNQTNKF